MVFETYVAGPLETGPERLQMDEIIRALNAAFGPRNETVRLIVDIRRNVQSGVYKQIDGLLITAKRLFVLEIKGVLCERLTVQYDPELSDGVYDRRSSSRTKPQPPWLIDGKPWEHSRENPLDQIKGQRSNLIGLILNRIRNIKKAENGSGTASPKEDDPAWQLGRAISGFIVFTKGEVDFGTKEAEHYVKSRRWLAIVPMDMLITRILAETAGRADASALVSEDEVRQLVTIMAAERRPFHRWSGTPLEHEYTEISRVPSLDFQFESDDPQTLLKAIEGAHQFRLRAYATDVADVFYRTQSEDVKERALVVLANWDYPSLGDLMVHGLEGRGSTRLVATALEILCEQNDHPETLPALESLMNRSYDSESDFGQALTAVKAAGKLRNQEAASAIHDLFVRATQGDYYARLGELARDMDPERIRRVRFELDLMGATLEGMAACGDASAAGHVRALLTGFPVERYLALIGGLRSPGTANEMLEAARVQSALQTALQHLTVWIGRIWDGNGEAEILEKVDAVYQRVLREEGEPFGHIAVYVPFVRAIAGIGSPACLTTLEGHLTSLPSNIHDSMWRYDSLRETIIEAIAEMHLPEGSDFLAERLRDSLRDPKPSSQEIVSIVDSLRRSGDLRQAEAISTVLGLAEGDSESEWVGPIRQEAAEALGELGGKRAFEILLQCFVKERGLAFHPLLRILERSDAATRTELARSAEALLLSKFNEATLKPGSHESGVLAAVASENSLELLFALARRREWYHEALPQRITDFAHVGGVTQRLMEMLGSKEDHQRAFAIDMVSGSGCLGRDIDGALSNLEGDPSALVKCSLVDHHAFIEKDALAVARYLGDRDAIVRDHAIHAVRYIPHRGHERCLVISQEGPSEVHRIIWNNQGLFFLGANDREASPDGDSEPAKPFAIAANCMERIYLHSKKVRWEGGGTAALQGICIEETGANGRRLMILAFRRGGDELELSEWSHRNGWMDDLVRTFDPARGKGAGHGRVAEDLMDRLEQGYLPKS